MFGLIWAVVGTVNLHAEVATVRGYWREPSGSVIRIAPCGSRLCADLVALPTTPHPSADLHNPNRSLRERPLCGLRIGEGFIEHEAGRADGGYLYDPKSGRTYRGSMRSDGDHLKLRGYVGLKIFGRTETWTRVHGAPRCI